MKSLKRNTLLIALTLFMIQAQSQQVDWLSWRGPSGNGISPETNWIVPTTDFKEQILWTVNIGMGHSAATVQGNKLFIIGNYEITDTTFEDKIVCLDTETGKELWSYKYPCIEDEDPGPYATPAYSDGYIFSYSRERDLICLNASNGELVWQRNLVDEEIITADSYVACSPVPYKDIVIMNLNKNGIAFNKKTGEIVWNSPKDRLGYSTAILFNYDDKTFATIQNMKKTFIVDAETGKLQWGISSAYISDPIIDEDEIIVFGKGIQRFKFKNSTTTEHLWTNSEADNSFQSYVLVNNNLYGFDDFNNNHLQCIDAKTGETKWRVKMSAGNLIASNNTLIIIDKKGKMRFAEANPNEYKEISSAQVINNVRSNSKGRGYRRECACWTYPVLSGGKIYVRNTYGELACIDVSNN